jgi:hypothetical protein
MSLTVPTAGNSAGRSASIQVATPDTGGVIAQFGQKLTEIVGGWKAEQDDYATKKAQLGITKDLGIARLEAEQSGNMAEAGALFDQRQAEIRAKYMPVDGAGNSTLSERQQHQLDLAFTDLSDKHTLALSEKAVNWTRSEADANWTTARNDITVAAVGADPDTFGALLKLGESEIDGRLQRGFIDPARAAADKEALRQDVYKGRANALIDQDPAAFIAQADAGTFDGLGGELLSSRRVVAQNEIARREKEALTEATRLVKAREVVVGTQIADLTDIFSHGRSATDEAARMEDPEFKAHKDYPKLQAAQALKNEYPAIQQMTPAEFSAAIAAEEKRPITKSWENERLATLKSWQAKLAEKWNTKPADAARDAGMGLPDLPDLDPADPSTFATGIAKRLAFDQAIGSEGYTKLPTLFESVDQAKLKPLLDAKADPAKRLALAQGIAAGAGPKTDRVTSSLEADPVFNRAARLIATTGDSQLAGEILRGQQRIALKSVLVPTDKIQTQIFDGVTTGALAGVSDATRAEIRATSEALYAASAEGIDPTDDPGKTEEIYSQAVQRALGASADSQGQLTIGGIQEINGLPVALPRGVAKSDVQFAWDRIEKSLSINDYAEGGAQYGKPIQYLSSASLYGGEPDLGKDPEALFSALTPRRVGESDVYELTYMANGRSYAVRQKDGQGFRFRMSALLSGASDGN